MFNSQNSSVPAIQNPELLNLGTLQAIFEEAKKRAVMTSNITYEKEGGDRSECGFVWVEIRGIKGNTKLGKALKKIGIKQGYNRAFHIWNPSGLSVQSIAIKEAGAIVFAKYLRTFGFDAFACSRLINLI